MHFDIVGAEVVFTQRKRVFQNLIQLHGQALGLVLARETQQVLHDAMRSLRLLVELLDVIGALRADDIGRSQQLPVTQNRRQGIVQFVRHAGNELPDGGHFFALQELLLRAPQIFVRRASFFIELHFFDGDGNLAADGRE